MTRENLNKEALHTIGIVDTAVAIVGSAVIFTALATERVIGTARKSMSELGSQLLAAFGEDQGE